MSLMIGKGAGATDIGDVYIAETNNRRIGVLDRHGNFKFAFGRNVVISGGTGDLPGDGSRSASSPPKASGDPSGRVRTVPAGS